MRASSSAVWRSACPQQPPNLPALLTPSVSAVLAMVLSWEKEEALGQGTPDQAEPHLGGLKTKWEKPAPLCVVF